MDSVYIETTVVGSIAGRIHPNPDVASRQHKTRRWWATAKTDYNIAISHLFSMNALPVTQLPQKSD
jgi:hypothetical protein